MSVLTINCDKWIKVTLQTNFPLCLFSDELLCRVNISLARKPSQTVREHLIQLQGPPYSPFEGHSELCEKVTCLYEHARYGAKVRIIFSFLVFSQTWCSL